MTWAIVAILVYHCICAVSWKYERQVLLNKLMSRNFDEYKFVNDREMDPPKKDLREEIKAEQALAEDLAPIEGFGLN